MKITARQQQVLDFLQRHIGEQGVAPSIHELMAAFGWASPNAVTKHLEALSAKGLIATQPHKARSIRLLRTNWSADGEQLVGTLVPSPTEAATATDATTSQARGDLVLPLFGRVAAGEPIASQARVERMVRVDRWLFRPTPNFLLRVQGDSMVEAGILDGDLIAGKSTPDAAHGQIVIARVGEGITIKRLYRQPGQLRLLPHNAAYAPIEPDPQEDFAIEGIYCGLVRRA